MLVMKQPFIQECKLFSVYSTERQTVTFCEMKNEMHPQSNLLLKVTTAGLLSGIPYINI